MVGEGGAVGAERGRGEEAAAAVEAVGAAT